MTRSTEREKRPDLDLIVELLDNEGYTQTELSEKTGKQESNITNYIKKFKEDGIVYRKEDFKKQKARGKGGSDIYVYIGPERDAKPEEKLNVFQFIFKSFFSEPKWDATKRLDCTKRLLASKYFNFVIEKCGLKPIYKIFEEYMKQEEFRGIASQTLMSQPALIDEYINLPSSIEVLMEVYWKRDDVVFNDLEHDTIDTRYLLKFLFRLDESESLKFYRLYLAEPFGRLYRKLTQRDVPITLDKFVTEGIRKFLELDLFLSPFTSFPINFPVDLLFGRPFERLYTDFYLCDEEDIKKLIRRAHIVYSNFIDVVSAGVVSSGISCF